MLDPCEARTQGGVRQQRLADREGGSEADRAALQDRGQNPGRGAGDAPVRTVDRVGAAGERLRRVARRAALAGVAALAPGREAHLHRQPVGRAAGVPLRRARRDGLELRRESNPTDQADREKRAVRGPRRRRGRVGLHRFAHRDVQDEWGRALRLAQEHAGEDRRRSSSIPDPRTPALELRPGVKLKTKVVRSHRLPPFRRSPTCSSIKSSAGMCSASCSPSGRPVQRPPVACASACQGAEHRARGPSKAHTALRPYRAGRQAPRADGGVG